MPLLKACGVVVEVTVCVALSLLVTVMVASGATVRAIGWNMKSWMTIVSDAAALDAELVPDEPAVPVEVAVDVEEQPASSSTVHPATAVAAVVSS